MTKAQIVEGIWELVVDDKIGKAVETARKYDVFIAFDGEYIMVEEDVFRLQMKN